MSLFELKNVTKVFVNGEVRTEALKGVTFNIDRGEFVSIMGPSGSGKSTLLHIMGFLSRNTDGSYKFNGKEFNEYSDDEIARVRNREMGFVFQTFNLLGRNTVYENVRLPLLYSDIPEKEWDRRIRRSVDEAGLSHRIDYKTSRLSGGERQRAAIARALVNEPRVIFADEPTGNLDSKTGGLIMDMLQGLHREKGHTIILITHEESTAEYAERMIKILDGEIEKDFKVQKRRHNSNGYSK